MHFCGIISRNVVTLIEAAAGAFPARPAGGLRAGQTCQIGNFGHPVCHMHKWLFIIKTGKWKHALDLTDRIPHLPWLLLLLFLYFILIDSLRS